MFRRGSVSAALLLLMLTAGFLAADPGGVLAPASLTDAPAVLPSLGDVPSVPPASTAPTAPSLPAASPPPTTLGAPVVDAAPSPAGTASVPPLLAASPIDPHDALLLGSGATSGLGLAFAPTLPDPARLGAAFGPTAAVDFAMQASSLRLDDLQQPVVRAAGLVGVQVNPAHYAHEEGAGALERAVLHVYDVFGLPTSAQQRALLHDRASAVPLQVAAPTALIVDSIADAQVAINKDLSRLAPQDYALLYQCARLGPRPDAAGCPDVDRARIVARTVDRGTIVSSGLSVLSAIQQGLPSLEDWGKAVAAEKAGKADHGDKGDAGAEEQHSQSVQPYDPSSGQFRDPWGLIEIGSFGDDVYRGNSVTLAGWDSRVQLLTLDFGGDDTYTNTAGGTVLFPVQDVKPTSAEPGSLQPTQLGNPVSAVFGSLVSVTLDLAGNDRYLGYSGVQGSGTLGVGLLLDLGGDDTYDAVAAAQGYALVGLGAVYDANGNDQWGSASMFRGEGFGSLGGIGIVEDVTGNDNYNGQMLVQGAGSTDGVGVLIDTGGDDHYAAWTSSAPYAAIAQGASHMMAVGILADTAGNDDYQLSGGGHGWVYVPSAAPYNVGSAVFYDGAGVDIYGGSGPGANGSVWYQGILGYGKDN